jgi:hypothetical protein
MATLLTSRLVIFYQEDYVKRHGSLRDSQMTLRRFLEKAKKFFLRDSARSRVSLEQARPKYFGHVLEFAGA